MKSDNQQIVTNAISELGNSGIFVKRLDRGSNHEIKDMPHRDDYYMFGIVLSGAVTITVDFTDINLSSDNMSVITPGQVHGISHIDENSTGYLLGLSPYMLSDSEIEIIDRFSLFPEPIFLNETTRQDIISLFDILQRRGLKHLAKSIVEIILPFIRDKESGKTGRYVSMFIRFKGLLNNNICNVKQPSAYADMLNITEVYLNEIVKAVTGISVSRYIMGQAVLNAKRLFVNTSLSAKQIAKHLGYDDYTYFSKLFKKIEGISPAGFRKNLK